MGSEPEVAATALPDLLSPLPTSLPASTRDSVRGNRHQGSPTEPPSWESSLGLCRPDWVAQVADLGSRLTEIL